MNDFLCPKKILNFLSLMFFFLCFSSNAQSANQSNCTSSVSVKNITVTGINISPNSQIGDPLSNADQMASDIGHCTNIPNNVERPYLYHDSANFASKGVARHNGDVVNYTYSGLTCNVYNTGVDGIGIVWFNYNSGANKWLCIGGSISRGLPIDSNATVQVTDVVILVRTGDITPGTFNYNITLPTYIVDGIDGKPTNSQAPIYIIKVNAPDTEIKVGTCNISYDKNTLIFSNLPTRNIITKYANLSQKVTVNLDCQGGFVPNVVNIKPVSSVSYLGDSYSSRSTNEAAGLYLLNDETGSYITYNNYYPVTINNLKGSITFTPSVYSALMDARTLGSSTIQFDVDMRL